MRYLLHRILLLCFLALALPASAQHSTLVTVSHLLSAGTPVPYATICATPADSNGNPINLSAPGWGFLLKSHPLCASLVNGALPSGLRVPDAAHIRAALPIHYNFRIQVTNAKGVATGPPILIDGVPNVTGSTFALDSYTPAVTLDEPPTGIVYTTGKPTRCSGQSITIDQTAGVAYMCIKGVPTPFSFSGTATHANNADTASTAVNATNASHAVTADRATTANTATKAITADDATHATTADVALAARSLTSAPTGCPSGEASNTFDAQGNATGCFKAASGSVQASPHQQFAWYGTPGTNSNVVGDAGSSTDGEGNVQFVSVTPKNYSGTRDATLNQTSPGSNNGIQNSLQTEGSVVTANQGYPNVEAPVNYGFRGPFYDNGSIYLVPVPPYAKRTTLFDYRADSRGRFDYNLGERIPTSFDTSINDETPTGNNGPASFFPFVEGHYQLCCGVPQISGIQNVIQYRQQYLMDNTMGISALLGLFNEHAGTGDTHAFEIIERSNGGCPEGSGECSALMRLKNYEDPNPFWGTLPSGMSTGATVLHIKYGAGSNMPGEGRWLSDKSKARTPFLVTSVGDPNGGALMPGIWQTDATFTPDTMCRLNGAVTTPQLAKGATTATTLHLTGCTAAITTRSVACIDDNVNGMEQVIVSSADPLSDGNQTIKANLRLSHLNNAPLSQGPQACTSAEVLANRFNNGAVVQPYTQMILILGAPTSSTLYYESRGAGNWLKAPNGNFSTMNIAAGTLTRDGSGIVSAAIGVSDYGFAHNNATVIITSAADPSYNGTFMLTQTDPYTVTWSNPGKAGSTTTRVASSLKVNGVPANQVMLVPGAVVVQAVNPLTNELDGTVVVEANNIAWGSGDIVASSPNDENPVVALTTEIQYTGTPSPSLGGQIIGGGQVVNPCDGCSLNNWFVQANSANYVGGGGTRFPTLGANNYLGAGVFHYYLQGNAPDNTGFITHIYGCGIRPCNDPGAKFTENQYDVPGLGVYHSEWNEFNLNYFAYSADNFGAGTRYTITPASYVINSGDGSGNAMLGAFSPTSNKLALVTPTASSNFVQTATAFSVDKPMSMPAGSTINSKLPCLQDGTNCPNSRSVSSELDAESVEAGTCSHLSIPINGLSQRMTISVSSQSDPGPGVTITMPYWTTPDVANFRICAPAANASNAVTLNIGAR